MVKRCFFILLAGLSALHFTSFADTQSNITFSFGTDMELESDLLQEPTVIHLEVKFCAPNEYTASFHLDQIDSLCWLQADQNLINLDYPEAIEVRWADGRILHFYPSPFIFDIELTRKHGAQILRAHFRGHGLVSSTVSYVFKVFTTQSGLRFDDVPDRIMGVLPSGQRFSFRRPMD